MMRILLLAILISGFSAKAQFYKDLEFKTMENFTFEKTENNLIIGFDYVIYNPNWYKIVIKPSSLKLTIAGSDCGWVTVDKKVKILKKKEQAYSFRLVGDSEKFARSAFASMFSMLTGNGVTFNISGKLKAGAFLIRKKWDIDYDYVMSYEEFISFF